MYSFICDHKEEKRAKGVAKVTVKRDLKFQHYKETLFDEAKKVSSMTSLRSHSHELFGETINKTGLSAFDDKRYLILSMLPTATLTVTIKSRKPIKVVLQLVYRTSGK